MASLRIECLRCGEVRAHRTAPKHHIDSGECPRCGYVGWASSADLTEPLRRSLRERPLERRRLRVA
jgi:hypothetical protein